LRGGTVKFILNPCSSLSLRDPASHGNNCTVSQNRVLFD